MDATNLTRRRLLQALGAAGLSAVWPGPSPDAAARAMLERRIPASGEAIPAVGLGTARQFDVGAGESARAPLREVLRRFIAHGGRVIDSSPMYGAAESVIGDLLGDLRHPDMFYATKVWTRGREAGVEQMERSMRRMGTQVMDLMQVHNLVDWRTHLKTLRAWKDDGRVRYVGITHYVESAFDELASIMRQERLDFVQLPYNLARRRAEARLLPLARDRGIAVMVNVPFGNGALFRAVKGKPLPGWAAEAGAESWAQVFLKFILSHPDVTCVIPATSDPAHLVDNMGAGTEPLPDAALRERMVEHWERAV